MANITIAEISRRTGLSRGTVSRAINDHPDISAEAKQRVLAECRRLNYVPSRAARSLATGRNYLIAMVVDEAWPHAVREFRIGVVLRAARSQYAVNVVFLAGNEASRVETLRRLANERFDGTLLAARLSSRSEDVLCDAFRGAKLVSIFPLAHLPCDVLRPDPCESGRLVARLLLPGADQGQVAYVHDAASSDARARLDGFAEVCREHGIDASELTVRVPTEGTMAQRAAAIEARVANVARLAASCDFVALTLMMMCLRRGHVPGDDVAIAGQGNEYVAASIWPGLTTTDLNALETGRRAMETLLRGSKARGRTRPRRWMSPRG